MRALLILPLLFINLAHAATPLRIENLQRCGNLLDSREQRFCITAHGLDDTPLQVQLNNVSVPYQRDGQHLVLQLRTDQVASAPVYLQQGSRSSNGVWLSMAGSHVVAARPDEVAKNMDGLTTYVDLVSVIIEERFDGLEQANALARKYGAEVVGAIAPLNTYQLRLPVTNLTERDAMVLRIGSEVAVDAVVIEESGAEKEEAAAPAQKPSPDQDEWAANRFLDAVNYYQRRIPSQAAPITPVPIKVGVIERNVDFDAPDFASYLGRCPNGKARTCLYGRDAGKPDNHGSTVAGVLAAQWSNGGNSGLLRGLDGASQGFDVIVERGSDAGITANVAASVNLVQDGVRVLNWSWGLHRVGARNVDGDEIDSLVRSGLAMGGYEELLEEFFLWLRAKHPEVVVVNSAGNGASFSGTDEYRLPSSFVTDQLLVVGGHQRSEEQGLAVDDPHYVEKRASSNIDRRVDITASACAHASTALEGEVGDVHCGTSYATPMVAGVVAAMLSLNPSLTPEQLRMLLRRSAMTIGGNYDFEPMDADDLTAPILPSERDYQLDNVDVGRSARLDMQKALELAVESRDRRR
ncbi:S8 family peptidase [Pseudomonas sp. UBA4194]|uniref:S8 family peptidase n=1 Tax=Pseudomonas sp. UBA4194 TaxID=1947317 RepID=UPI0025F7AC9F|nr:S8/S53 family peptidase [Pseudomonas sp. UBA4194]